MHYLFILFCFVTSLLSSSNNITEYKIHHEQMSYKQQPFTMIRSMKINDIKFYLLVNNHTLETSLHKDQNINYSKIPHSNSRYEILLNKYQQPPFLLQNYGAKNVNNSKKVYLTMDMCPSSKKGFEEHFVKELARKYKKDLTLTIFISADWIKHHFKEFQSLKALEKDINIIWANHTSHHPYFKGKALKENFLLAKNVDIKNEILHNEKVLLSHGITPSILFRYPGLVSNEKANTILNQLGLIPIGSNTWLAKEERIKEGSIILIHGNKNEPYGIQKAQEYLIDNTSLPFGSLLEDLY